MKHLLPAIGVAGMGYFLGRETRGLRAEVEMITVTWDPRYIRVFSDYGATLGSKPDAGGRVSITIPASRTIGRRWYVGPADLDGSTKPVRGSITVEGGSLLIFPEYRKWGGLLSARKAKAGNGWIDMGRKMGWHETA